MKGQAFVVFKDVSQSSEAHRALQNFKFFGKEMVIQFAKGQSEIVAKREGTFNPLAKKRAKQRAARGAAAAAAAAAPGTAPEPKRKEKKEEEAKPTPVSNILKVSELPAEVTVEMLETLFKQYPGYVRAQMVLDKAIAFIEYDTEDQATTALKGLKEFLLNPGKVLKVDYAQ